MRLLTHLLQAGARVALAVLLAAGMAVQGAHAQAHWQADSTSSSLSLGGLARLTITSATGYVGIGTVSPNSLLDVNGAATVGTLGSGLIAATGISITTNQTSVTSLYASGRILLDNGQTISMKDETGTTREVLKTAVDGSVSLYGYHGTPMIYGGGGATYIYSSSAGGTPLLNLYAGTKLGVGADYVVPSTTLHVSGTIRISDGGEACDTNRAGAIKYASSTFYFCSGSAWQSLGDIAASSSDRITSGTTNVYARTDGSISFTTAGTTTGYFYGGKLVANGISITTNQTSVTSLYASGNVGVGTPVPTGTFEISSSLTNNALVLNGSAPGLVLKQNGTAAVLLRQTAGVGLVLSANGGYHYFGYDYTHAGFRFYNGNSTELMRLTGTGSLGISVATPSTTLHVSGTLRIADGGEACDTNRAGAIKYSSSTFYFCSGSAWQSLGDIAASSSDRITSGTTNVYARTDGSISFTTAGTTTGYFYNGQLVASGVSTTGTILAPTTSATATNAYYTSTTELTAGTATVGSLGSGLIAATGISITTNQTSVTSLYASGNVGIGTASPAQKLTVSGGNILLDNGNAILMKDDIGTARSVLTTAVDGSLVLNGYHGTPMISGVEGATYIYSSGSGGNPSLNIYGGTLVGVGMASVPPSTTLHVSGTLRLSDGGEACDTNRAGAIRYTNGDFQVCYGSGGWTSLVDASGTTVTPDRITSGTTNVYARTDGSISFTTAGTTTGYFYGGKLVANGVSTTGGISGTTGYFNGDVGIGTSTAWARLSVGAGASDPSTTAYTGGFVVTDITGYTNSGLEIGSARTAPYGVWMQTKIAPSGNGAGTYPLSLQPLAGNVGIGTSSPNAKLDVNGTVSATAFVGGTMGLGVAPSTFPLYAYVSETTGTNYKLADFKYVSTNGGGSGYVRIEGGNSQPFDMEQNAGGNGPFRYGTYSDTNLVNNNVASSGAYGNLNFVTGNGSGLGIVMSIRGGTEKGYVGINTTSPNAALGVVGTVSATAFVGDGSGLTGLSGGDKITSSTTKVTANSTHYISFTNAGTVTGYIDSSGRLITPGISATTNQTSVTSLYASGNVGIGTSPNASYKMYVNGAVYAASDGSQVGYYLPNGAAIRSGTVGGNAYLDLGNVYFRGGDAAGAAARVYVSGAAAIGNGIGGATMSDGELRVAGAFTVSTTGQSTTPTLYVNTSGNVGIGTSSPVSKLHLNATSPQITLQSGYGTSGILQDGNTASTIFANDAGAFVFKTGTTWNGDWTATGTERVRITNAGNVGIGTTAPSQPFEVRGHYGSPATSGISQNGIAAFSSSDTYGTLYIGNLAAVPWSMWLQASGRNDLSVNYSLALNPNGGNVGVGKSAPNATLDVAGTVSATAFVGDGSGLTGLSGGDKITSSTTKVTANSTHYISFTNAGTVTGYIDSSGRHILPGISATTNQTSVTTLYTSKHTMIGGSTASQAAGVDHILSVYTTPNASANALYLGGGTWGAAMDFDATATGTGGHFYQMSASTNANGVGGGKWMIYDYTSSSARIVLDGNGNMAVGAITPTTKLDVYGTISGTITSATSSYARYASFTALTVGGVAVTGGGGDNITSSTTKVTANSTHYISFTNAGTVTGYIDSSGRHILPGISATTNQTSVTSLYASRNVGIGGYYDLPWGSSWSVLGANRDAVFGGSNGGPVYAFMTSNLYADGESPVGSPGWKGRLTGSHAALYEQLAGSHVFSTALSVTSGAAAIVVPRLTIETSGNVGIGTTAPGTPLEISATESSIRLRSSAGSVWDVVSGGNGNFSPGVFAIKDMTNSATRFLITGSGDVGIGTVAAPNSKLDVNGTVSATTLMSAGTVKMGKYTSQPVACAAGYDGYTALTSQYTTCVCNGGTSTWVRTSDGTTACSW